MIERFSEDADIALDKSFWGLSGDTRTQRDRIRKLADSGGITPKAIEKQVAKFKA